MKKVVVAMATREDLKAAYPVVSWREGKLLNWISKKDLETWVKGL